MKKVTAVLRWALDTNCPYCSEPIDASYKDPENDIFDAVFNNNWEDLTGYEIQCEVCGETFMLEDVEY